MEINEGRFTERVKVGGVRGISRGRPKKICSEGVKEPVEQSNSSMKVKGKSERCDCDTL